jgi:hypothetical protein
MKSHPTFERWRAALSVFCSLAVLLSCGGGGGVDSGGTGFAPPATLASGPVTGLGSVTVNGVRFDDSAASVVDQDDMALTTDQLQVGMLARIDASAVATTGPQASATALTIRTNSELIGPVDSVGPLGLSMVVLGQSVRVTVATWLDSALNGGLGAVTPGQVVEVWGQYNARTNEYVATRIAPRSNATFYEVRGLLAAVDPAAQTLVVGGLTISDASIAAAALPPLTVGKFVRVALATAPAGNVWNALKVAPGNTALADRPEALVLGRISSWTSSAQFVVDGIVVDASNATFPAGAAGVVLGARVVVTGSTSAGVLTASTVAVVGDETLANSTFEVHGVIASLDPVMGKLKVHGITINYSTQVQFSGGVIGDLAVGKNIDVVGTLDSGDRISIDAQTITFR